MPAPRTFSLKYPGWFEKRQDVRRKLDRINNGIWESEEEQIDYLRTVFGAVGEDLYFLEPVSFVNGKNIFIGDHVFINSNVTFIDAAPIEIGDHTMIAPGCVITTVDHPKQPGERRGFTSRAQASHFEAVWRLTPIWRAVSATPAPDPMRETSVSRPLGVSLALGCWDMGWPPLP